MTGTTVLLADDQEMIRAGLRTIVDSAPGLSVVGEAADGRRARELAAALRPDVVLMDLRMPVEDGVTAISGLRAAPDLADLRILVLTTFDGDPDVLAALRAGADGFLSKSAGPGELIDGITAVADGDVTLSQSALRAVLGHLADGPPPAREEADPGLAAQIGRLTDRERDMVESAALGLDNERIARERFISPYTVKAHLNRAMAKLGARDRGQLVSIAYRSGLMSRGGTD
ncbi:response regulator [Nocardiopsis changdeensis]|uniref:response regulator n=1 Tax=Nocardiopsis changdeensis TaxID=2831969 RepID=UPI003F4646E2